MGRFQELQKAKRAKNKMRVIFMGTPDFAVPSLMGVAQSGHELVGVVTRPDKPRGRGQQMQPTDVKAAVESLGLDVPVLQPESLKDESFHQQLRELQPDFFAVVAFLILPKSVLAIPKLGSVNVHPSLLPKYRGAAPIQWAIINGESETGVTIFLLSPRIDAGDVLIQEKVSIGADETAGELYERMKVKGAELLVQAIDGVSDGSLTPIPQTDEGVTRAPKLEKEDGRIDWGKSAVEICNLIRGTHPFPGAFTLWRDKLLKVHKATVGEGAGQAGSIIFSDGKAGVGVGTGDGVLVLDEVQPEGKKRMSSADLVRGYQVAVGEQLG